MRVLAFDVGRKKSGVALGNTITGGAQPLAVVRGGRQTQLVAVAALIAEWQPEMLLVGLPMNMDGTDHRGTAMCRKFGALLAKTYTLPVDYFDERLTSILAEKMGAAQKDAAAAGIILQGWMDQNAEKTINSV